MNIFYLLRKTFLRVTKRVTPYRTICVLEEPEVLQENYLYVLGSMNHFWAAVFICPCGCGSIIRLNLIKEAQPCWIIKFHIDSTPSLYPSINRTVGCKSHFWIQRGIVEWASFQHQKGKQKSDKINSIF
ncbi:MAG: DUF6527 family protein [Ignavibacteriaceae bacterium]